MYKGKYDKQVDYEIGDVVTTDSGETLIYAENGFIEIPDETIEIQDETNYNLDVLKQIRENCRKTKCKECRFYVSGKIVDKCLFDDMPMDWELYKLKEVKQNG